MPQPTVHSTACLPTDQARLGKGFAYVLHIWELMEGGKGGTGSWIMGGGGWETDERFKTGRGVGQRSAVHSRRSTHTQLRTLTIVSGCSLLLSLVV